MSDRVQPSAREDSAPLGDHSLQPEPPSIEKREELTPISPSPIHVTEGSDIPVLKNQMDPGLNTAIVGSFAQDENEKNDHEIKVEETNDDADFYEPSPQPAAEITQTKSSHFPSFIGVTSASTLSQPGMNNDEFRISATASTQTHTDTEIPMFNGHSLKTEFSDATINEMEATDILPNIDLQALLTKLSRATPQQSLSQDVNVMKVAPSGAVTSLPSSTKQEILPKPPPSTPMTHALPAPVTAAVDHPRALPSSLPNPATFQQKPPPSSSMGADEFIDRPFTAQEEEAFERFQEDEREYVSQGQWDRFPIGSRLFIGNLPSEKVQKRDLFRIFSRHGRLAQISIKQAYGFVQFLDVEACMSALREEQGGPLRGRKMHLEISKPQGKVRQFDSTTRSRRSRSPDYGPTSPRSIRSHPLPPRPPNRIEDRGYPRDRRGSRDRDWDHRERTERDYRPQAHPRERDDYRPHHRNKSRSPSPRYRSRSPSFHSDDIKLPHRAPADVPEVQIIALDDVDRNFLWFVEKAFRDRVIRVDVFFMGPRHELEVVVRRQVLEGVQAVVFLNRKMQAKGNISMRVFNRQGGEANVRFDEYDGIDPQIACELVIRARQTHAPVPSRESYSSAQMYGIPQQQIPSPAVLPQLLASVQGNPNLASLISSLDAATLQKLLTNLQQPHQPHADIIQQRSPGSFQQAHLSDLAAILSGRPSIMTAQPSQMPYNMHTNPSLLSVMHVQHNQTQPQPQAQQPALSTILETLKYTNR